MIITDRTPKSKPKAGNQAETWCILQLDTNDGTTYTDDYQDKAWAIRAWNKPDPDSSYTPIKLFKIEYKENE